MTLEFEALFYVVLFVSILLILTLIFQQRKLSLVKEEMFHLTNRNTTDNKEKRLKKMSLSLEQERVDLEKKLIQQIADLKLENEKTLNDLKERNRIIINSEYNKGFDEGVKQSAIDVQITPIKRITDEKGVFTNKKIINLGYSYQLFSRGIPCLEPREVIVESISSKELNEENIKIAIEKIEDIIDRIPNPSIQMVGSLKNFKENLNKDVIKN